MREDRRLKTEDRRGRANVFLFCLLSPVFCILLTSGCGESKEPSLYDRQEQAIKDPFSYNPDPKKSELNVTGDADKDAMKRDVDHVFNP